MTVRLLNFGACPFAQRATIIFLEKGGEVEWIDFANKAPLFAKLSPAGLFPVLALDEERALFDANAICEFLDETMPGERLMPSDPAMRARDRAKFASLTDELFTPLVQFMRSPSQEEFAKRRADLEASLQKLEAEMEGRQWLSGDGTRYGMADAVAAGFFTRVPVLERLGKWSIPAKLERVRAWGERLMARAAVARSVPANLDEQLRGRMMAGKSVMVS